MEIYATKTTFTQEAMSFEERVKALIERLREASNG